MECILLRCPAHMLSFDVPSHTFGVKPAISPGYTKRAFAQEKAWGVRPCRTPCFAMGRYCMLESLL